ncbi:hypothetical protein OFD71_29535, partial [Escherichia coli]|nr:hypothetical protein [Escherichia coli]
MEKPSCTILMIFMNPVVFNIMDLARTARTQLATKTRRNVQKYGFCCPQTGCSGVASLLSESQIRLQPVCRLKA